MGSLPGLLIGVCIRHFPRPIVDARYDKVPRFALTASSRAKRFSSLSGSTERAATRSWAFELANRESRSNWREFLIVLRARGLHGIVASMTTTA